MASRRDSPKAIRPRRAKRALPVVGQGEGRGRDCGFGKVFFCSRSSSRSSFFVFFVFPPPPPPVDCFFLRAKRAGRKSQSLLSVSTTFSLEATKDVSTKTSSKNVGLWRSSFCLNSRKNSFSAAQSSIEKVSRDGTIFSIQLWTEGRRLPDEDETAR